MSISTPTGDVTIIPKTQSVMLRGPQFPQSNTDEFPEGLRELLRPRQGNARDKQAEDILSYLQRISSQLNILFRHLVYCIGEIKRQQLYREIGAAAGLDVPINSVDDLCRLVLKIDPRLAKEAEATYENVTPFLREIKPPDIDEAEYIRQVYSTIDQASAASLRNVATQAKAQKKARKGAIPEEEKVEFREDVTTIMAGGKPTGVWARGRREEIEPRVIQWEYEIIKPDDSAPYIKIYPPKLFMGDLLALKAHRAMWLPSEDGVVQDFDILIKSMDEAFTQLAERKEIF